MMAKTAHPSLSVSVNAVRDSGFRWAMMSSDSFRVWAKGVAFRDDVMLNGPRLCAELVAALHRCPPGHLVEGLRSLVRQLNGVFSLIVVSDRLVYAAVDKVRSFPLFYGCSGERLCISDDAAWVRDGLPEALPDQICVREFELAGYVTGPNTLYTGLYQLQAGSDLAFSLEDGGPHLELGQHFSWAFGDYCFSAEDLIAQLDAAFEQAFRRLVASAEGRKIVLPLSGGRDSRLAALMLHRLGYSNVLCYSYGRPGNNESQTSRRVAEGLGLDWCFVPYTRDQWFSCYRSTEWASYAQYASGLCSVPVLQEWPAVRWLHDKESLDPDAVFVPGHSPVMALQVNEIYKLRDPRMERGPDALIEAVLRNVHYNLHGCSSETWTAIYRDRIVPAVQDQPTESPNEVAGLLDRWAWRERQSKFIANSVRAYEVWGYEWRLPFWDADVMAVWRRVPMELRHRKRLFAAYVDMLEGGTSAVRPRLANEQPMPRKLSVESAKAVFVGSRLRPHAKALYRTVRWIADYWRHPMLWYGINDFVAHLGYGLRASAFWAGALCINSLLARDELTRLGIGTGTEPCCSPSRWHRE